ncbi:MAG: TrkA family potassium uptake protein [bacterium]|nr:TrkA family potassium uptake protein [bacterium]
MKEHYVVVGLGMFGAHVARTLYEAGCDVVVLDRDRDAVQRSRDFASQAIVADVTKRENLESLALEENDVVILAMGESLEASILATLYFREMGIEKIIAKANVEDHGKILEKVGVSEVIYPEKDVALRLARRISSQNIIDFIPLLEGYSIEEVAVSKAIVGRKIRDLDLRRKYGVQIIAVKDVLENKVELIIDPDRIIKDSELMIILGKNSDLERIRSL